MEPCTNGESCACSSNNAPGPSSPPVTECHSDWFVPNCEQEPYLPQTVENELQRLKALKSFQMIDAQRTDNAADATTASPVSSTTTSPCEPVDVASTLSTMDHIVALARSMFQVPMALLSLTDLGRQCHLAQSGIPKDIKEIPRRQTICAHTILCTEDAFVVPDVSSHPQLRDRNLPNFVQFYAGVPLITPEGERIGAVCVLDSKPRPNGFSREQIQLLKHLSGMAMNALVERRSRLQQERKLKKATRVISSTVHDLLTPLTAVELALSLLHEDQDFQSKLLQHQKESIKIASNCIGVLGRMCRTMRDQHSASCKQQVDRPKNVHRNSSTTTTTTINLEDDENDSRHNNPDYGLTAESFRIMYGSGTGDGSEEDDSSSVFEKKALAAPRVTVVVKELVKNIHMAMDAIPKTIPIKIILHASVPPQIVTDDLKVLRCALNLLQHCASIANSGSIQLSIKPQHCKCGTSMLGFHCENRQEGASDIAADQSIMECCATSCSTSFEASSSSLSLENDCCHHNRTSQGLRSCSEINLYSVAMQVEAMGGDCGIQSNKGCDFSNGEPVEASYWFRVPLEAPTDSAEQPVNSVITTSLAEQEPACGDDNSDISCVNFSDDGKTLVFEAQPRRRRALIIEDSIVIRKVIANALSKIGFETVTAVNGMEGLQMLQSSLYDVVLCDFLMPVMDGLDCVHQYREWEKTHRQWLRQYIIGMSAHASDQDVERGLRVGMDCYKPKPLTYQGLKDLVEACEKNQQNLIANTLDKVDKKPLLNNVEKISYHQVGQPKMCLIASKDHASHDLARLTEAKGWKSLIVHDGEDALQALKKRNWDAVFLDENLPLLSGRKCATEFREWERENRVNSQKNILIMASLSKVAPNAKPVGADGILQKPIQPSKVEKVLQKAEEPSLHIIMR